MAKREELVVGAKFGKLELKSLFRTSATESQKRHGATTRLLAKCLCDCGNEWIGDPPRLGVHTISCGCELQRKITKHGLTKDPATKRLYGIWLGMKHRCYDKKQHNYDNYGGRGIRICGEWVDDPKAFVAWALANGYQSGLTLGRREVNGNYEPSNCRWATKKVQGRNRRNNRSVTAWGETKLLCEWLEDSRVTVKSRATIKHRIAGGWWSPELAFTVPPGEFGTRPQAHRVVIGISEVADGKVVNGELYDYSAVIVEIERLVSVLLTLPQREREELVKRFHSGLGIQGA